MKKYASTVAAVVLAGAFSGFSHADDNGNQPPTPAVMKSSFSTPSPMVKNMEGAPQLIVQFQSNQWDIQPSFRPNVNAFGKYLADHPNTQAEVIAYADHTGHGPANITLAQKRADAVAAYLVSNFAIAADRIKASGYGEVANKSQNITMASRQADRSAFGSITTIKS